MKRLIYIIIIILIKFSIIHAEDRINLDIDFARFKGIQSEINVEIYYALYPYEWNHVKTANGKYQGATKIELFLYKNSTLIYNKIWKMVSKADSVKPKDPNNTMVDLLRFSFPPGNYKAVLYAEDIHSTATSDSMAIYIQLNDFLKNSLYLSDIELCQSISKEKRSDLFTKNNLRVIPNPQRTFGHANPKMYYYFEIYNILDHIHDDKYNVEIYITDLDGKRVDYINPVKRKKTKVHDSSVEIGTIDISPLPSGSYWFDCIVSNSASKTRVKAIQTFYVYNPQIDKELAQKTYSPLGTNIQSLNKADLERELEYIRYLMTPNEKNEIKGIKDIEGKRTFLSTFWQKRDPRPATKINEFRMNYLQRIKIANQRFTPIKQGWRSDMGRVFLLYGEPTDIERITFAEVSRPVQIWTYSDLEGGVYFIFVDMAISNVFDLVHSTLKGEVKNYEWEYLLNQ